MLPTPGSTRSPGPNRFCFPVGMDWVLEGVLNAEAGLDLLLASRAEPIPDLDDSIAWYRDDLDEMGVQVQMTDDDTITAGLLRAAVHTGRKAMALFDVRGIRRAFDSLYEVTQMPIPENGAAVLVACESRWRDLPSGAYDANSINYSRQGPVSRNQIRSEEVFLPPADLRELAYYLRLPIVAPSSPTEVLAFVNHAIRLSHASRRTVMLLLTPVLVGGGETPWKEADPAMRSVPAASLHPESRPGTVDFLPLLEEARKRQLDHLFNAPVPGETAPLGFVTFGTAHSALRHALAELDLIGRIPILKLGMANPVDPRSAMQFLSRCREVAVFENGQPLIENQLVKIAQFFIDINISTPVIINRQSRKVRADVRSCESLRRDRQLELSPSDLIRCVDVLLTERDVKGTVCDLIPIVPELDLTMKNEDEGRSDLSSAMHSHCRIWGRILQFAFDDLSDQLAIPESGRPALRLRIDEAATTSFAGDDDERILILMDARRLFDIGRSVVTHAVRRSLNCTFLVLPAEGGSSPINHADEAERMIRGMIAHTDASRIAIGTCDPTDRPNFQNILRREILSDSASVLIIDYEAHHRTDAHTSDTQDNPASDFPKIEYHIQPASDETSLHLEWLLKHGWDDPRRFDGAHAPKVSPPKTAGLLAPPFDGWDGFEEWRIYRKSPRFTRLFLEGDLPDPDIHWHDAPYWRAHLCGESTLEVKAMSVLLAEVGMRMGFRIQMIQGRDAAGAFTQIVFSRPRQGKPADPISARIPDGSANLIIALGSASLAEALRTDGPHRAALPTCTHIVFDAGVNAFKQASSFSTNEFTPEMEDDPLDEQPEPDFLHELRRSGFDARSVPMQHLCEEYFYQRSLAPTALIGCTFQHGLIPATTVELEKATAADRNNATSQSQSADDSLHRAILLGRNFAENPSAFFPEESPGVSPVFKEWHGSRDSHPLHPRTPEHLIRKYVLAMSRRRFPGAGKGARLFEQLAFASLDAVTGLRRDDPGRLSERRFIARLIDCECWGGLRCCRVYADRIRALYSAESLSEDYEITRIIINELARAMLWIDPAYLCTHALRPDRIRAMLHRLHVNRVAGDRYTYRIRARVQTSWMRSVIGPYWKFTPFTAGIVRHAGFLRRMPYLYRQEKQYQEWILKLLDDGIAQMPQRRSLWLEVFRQLARVHGPAVQRRRRLHRVRLAVQSLLDLSNTQ